MHEAGTTLSHFRIEGELGRGGMGIVYEATDLRLGRRVALKVLRPDAKGMGSAEEAMAELEREARLAAAVSHPNLVTIFTFERVGQDALIAMELLQGYTLADRLRSGWRASVPEATWLMSEIATGVAAAHAAGIMHLDLKPGNVMILPDNRIKVLDFGIARMARTVGGPGEKGRGPIRGTPAYMAPEQLRGEALTPAADVWSLGAIAVHLLTGARPYEGTDPTTVSQAVMSGPPDVLRGRSPERLFGALTPTLQRCFVDRHERIATAAQLLAELRGERSASAAPRRTVQPPSQTSTTLALAPSKLETSPPRVASSVAAAPTSDHRTRQLGMAAIVCVLVMVAASVANLNSQREVTSDGGGGGSVTTPPIPASPEGLGPNNTGPTVQQQPPRVEQPLVRDKAPPTEPYSASGTTAPGGEAPRQSTSGKGGGGAQGEPVSRPTTMNSPPPPTPQRAAQVSPPVRAPVVSESEITSRYLQIIDKSKDYLGAMDFVRQSGLSTEAIGRLAGDIERRCEKYAMALVGIREIKCP